jgi:outer membrane protein insertion porin family
LTYTLSRNRLPGGDALGVDDDFYSKSILSVSSTIGKTNNYLNPRKGWLLRPFLETAGGIFGSDIQYVKGSTQLLSYIPITSRSELTSRLFAGLVIPIGNSADGLDGTNGTADSLIFENRFDDVLYYSGGSSSVRGWPDQLLGTKIARELFDSNGNELSPRRFAYEPVGGRSKIEASVSYRFPFPGLGQKWKIATFLDAGLISSQIENGGTGLSIKDDGSLRLSDALYSSGLGVRYQTLFGFVRLDVAAKLNPTDADLITAKDLLDGIDNPRQIRRFRLHLSIGQTF